LNDLEAFELNVPQKILEFVDLHNSQMKTPQILSESDGFSYRQIAASHFLNRIKVRVGGSTVYLFIMSDPNLFVNCRFEMSGLKWPFTWRSYNLVFADSEH
jgi:hypothetical protein